VLLGENGKLAVLARRAVLLQLEQTLRVFPVQEVHQVLLFFDEASLAQLALEFAENLLMTETLPPEFNEGVNLFAPLHRLDTLAPLPVVLVY